MNKMTLMAAGVFAVLASAGAAQADGYRFWNTSTPRIDAREAWQAREIEQGRRSGQLSAREYSELRAEQVRIHELERRAKADGYVSSAERNQLRAAQTQAERHIQRDLHNRETAGSGVRRTWYGRVY